MGEKTKELLELQFDRWLRLEFHETLITSDAGAGLFRPPKGV